MENNVQEAVTIKPVDSTTRKIKPAYCAIQVKYATMLNTSPDSITNITLYNFIDKWMSVPYKWGGVDERGIDCSAFLQRLYFEVYKVKIPRTSIEQLLTRCVEAFTSTQYLSEGDILFFRTMENKLVSHVGFYLKNNMFVNATSSKGVSMGSLNDAYWKKRFVVAGRVNLSLAKNNFFAKER